MTTKFDLIKFFHENTKRNIYYPIEEPSFITKPHMFKEYPNLPRIVLQKPITGLDTNLDQVILGRRSCRNFRNEALTQQELSKLLWYSYGITDKTIYERFEVLGRPNPSAGALYPFELYLSIFNVEDIEPGIYHYCPIDHSLEQLKIGNFSNKLVQYFMGQYYISDASLIIMLSGITDRITWKYDVRGYRYLLIEAGHIVQTLNLIAVSLNLAGLCLGGFYDDPLCEFIGIDSLTEPIIYGLAIGHQDELASQRDTILTEF